LALGHGATSHAHGATATTTALCGVVNTAGDFSLWHAAEQRDRGAPPSAAVAVLPVPHPIEGVGFGIRADLHSSDVSYIVHRDELSCSLNSDLTGSLRCTRWHHVLQMHHIFIRTRALWGRKLRHSSTRCVQRRPCCAQMLQARVHHYL
jgi:hypothetical protein